jgi:hypothetical protein
VNTCAQMSHPGDATASVGVMPIETYLELGGLEELLAARSSVLIGVQIRRVSPPDGALNRWFYQQVGRRFGWADLAGLSAFGVAVSGELRSIPGSPLATAGGPGGTSSPAGRTGRSNWSCSACSRGSGAAASVGELLTHAARTAFEDPRREQPVAADLDRQRQRGAAELPGPWLPGRPPGGVPGVLAAQPLAMAPGLLTVAADRHAAPAPALCLARVQEQPPAALPMAFAHAREVG